MKGIWGGAHLLCASFPHLILIYILTQEHEVCGIIPFSKTRELRPRMVQCHAPQEPEPGQGLVWLSLGLCSSLLRLPLAS